jgi:hypothetical protein
MLCVGCLLLLLCAQCGLRLHVVQGSLTLDLCVLQALHCRVLLQLRLQHTSLLLGLLLHLPLLLHAVAQHLCLLVLRQHSVLPVVQALLLLLLLLPEGLVDVACNSRQNRRGMQHMGRLSSMPGKLIGAGSALNSAELHRRTHKMPSKPPALLIIRLQRPVQDPKKPNTK